MFFDFEGEGASATRDVKKLGTEGVNIEIIASIFRGS